MKEGIHFKQEGIGGRRQESFGSEEKMSVPAENSRANLLEKRVRMAVQCPFENGDPKFIEILLIHLLMCSF